MANNEKVVSQETGKIDLQALLKEIETEKKSSQFASKQASQSSIAELLQSKRKKKKKKK